MYTKMSHVHVLFIKNELRIHITVFFVENHATIEASNLSYTESEQNNDCTYLFLLVVPTHLVEMPRSGLVWL